MGLVVDYWLQELSTALKPAKTTIHDVRKKVVETGAIDYLEAGMGFQYQEGEVVEYVGDIEEYQGDNYVIEQRDIFRSFLGEVNGDLRYDISRADDYRNNTITVCEDELL